MNQVALIVSEIYNKYLPEAKKYKVQLDLDLTDTASATDDTEQLAKDIEEHLQSALKRTREGEIKVAIKNGEIAISDTGTTLSRPVCQLLTRGRVQVKSRVGFGTTVKIRLHN